MKCPHQILCLILLIIHHEKANAGMTEKQLQSAVKLARNVCQPRSKASSEEIDNLRNGHWDVDKKTMCYLYCLLSMNRLINADNTFSFDTAVSMAKKQLPTARLEPGLDSANKCKDAAKTLDDNCVAAYEIGKCLYESNPSNYFL